jgi:hypothetical protein
MSALARWLCIGTAVVASGCSVPLQDAAPFISNTCETEQDCGSGATCADLGDRGRSCVATEGDLGGLLLDVRPPVGSNGTGTGSLVLGGGAYLIEPELLGVRIAGSGLGGVIPLDVALPPPVTIQAGRIAAFAAGDACAAAPGASIPAEVVFSRATRHAGLPAGEFRATTAFVDGENIFTTALPAGRYDVYVRPLTPEACVGADLEPLPAPPPYLIRGLEIGSDTGQINIALPEPKTLSGSVDGSAALGVDDWTVGLLDRVTAQLISTEVVLVQDGLGVPSLFDVSFHPTKVVTAETDEHPSAGFPYVRVRAPEDQGYSPSMVGGLEELDLDGNYEVALTLGDLSKAVDVKATVLSTDASEGVAATVTFEADFEKGLQYQRTLTTELDGSFHTSLITASAELPGQYQCFARPIDDASPEAIGTVNWQINPGEDFVGHTMVLPLRALVSGTVVTAGGEAVEAQVTAAQSTHNGDPISPRAVQGVVSGGALELHLDPGTFDLAIKPAAGSGFPWLVTSQLEIVDDKAVALGQLEVPNPIVLQGRLVDAGGNPVPLAPMTAWLPILDEESSTSTVVQVAQTVSDETGAYTLFLPPSLAH